MKEKLDLMDFGLKYNVVFILATIGGRQSLIFFSGHGWPNARTRENRQNDEPRK